MVVRRGRICRNERGRGLRVVGKLAKSTNKAVVRRRQHELDLELLLQHVAKALSQCRDLGGVGPLQGAGLKQGALELSEGVEDQKRLQLV